MLMTSSRPAGTGEPPNVTTEPAAPKLERRDMSASVATVSNNHTRAQRLAEAKRYLIPDFMPSSLYGEKRRRRLRERFSCSRHQSPKRGYDADADSTASR